MTHKAVDSLLRLAGRELKRALEDDEALDEGPARTLYGRRLRARLTKAQLRELNRHLREIEALFAAADTRRARAGGSVALTLTLAPSPAQGAR